MLADYCSKLKQKESAHPISDEEIEGLTDYLSGHLAKPGGEDSSMA
jgi:hypothetical protein